MTLDQIRAFANSRETHIRQIALTKEGARQIIREHDREVNAASGDPDLLDLKDRDDSQYVSQQFGRIAACLADEAKLMGEGLETTAGKRERGCL